MEDYLTPEEKQELIDKNIVLSLGDRAAKDKLLGMQVDMHY